ncbi:MAG TPA: hypothetical protein VN688_00425 [Gemmataceae bacterium]|nr:hypothetical protein [Gemmataceae bacterium]
MARCPSCDYPLPQDRERLGARCPNCRDPLYEPPERIGRPAREGEGACVVHPGQEAVGTCGRCGNYFCEVCRTRWRDQVLCAACVERALASREAAPGQARAQFRQALLGLLLGGGAWTALILVALLSLAGTPPVLLGLLVLFLIAASLLMGVLGLGQAVAVLRTRGSHMILGIIGLIVSGLYMGVFIGIFTFSLWIS